MTIWRLLRYALYQDKMVKPFDKSGRHLSPDGFLDTGNPYWTLPDDTKTTDYGEWVTKWLRKERQHGSSF